MSVNMVNKSTSVTDKSCNRCGGKHKLRQLKMPSHSAYCKKLGHWAKVCFKIKQAVSHINHVCEHNIEGVSLYMLSGTVVIKIQ